MKSKYLWALVILEIAGIGFSFYKIVQSTIAKDSGMISLFIWIVIALIFVIYFTFKAMNPSNQ
jgi:hypothetical protein